MAGGQEEEVEEAVRWGAGRMAASLEAAAVHVAYQQEPSVVLKVEVPSEVRQGVAAVAWKAAAKMAGACWAEVASGLAAAAATEVAAAVRQDQPQG